MSSKIGGIDGTSPSGAIGAGRSVPRPQDASTGSTQGSNTPNGSNGSNESIQITGVARQLANLERAVRDLPAVNDAKVAQISSAIEQGTYSIDSRQIAQQLVQMEKTLKGLADPSTTDPDPDSGAE